jgi:5-oxoprolinase (ATP-hydrolysing) subunit A
MILDPHQVAERVARMAREGVVWSVEGSKVHVNPRTICFHPDTPGIMPMLEKARRLLTECGVMVDKETLGT